MTVTSRLAAIALASLLVAGTAVAQTPAPAVKTETADKKATKERSAESLECSRQADAKGLKGKERKKFRRECKRAAKAGGAADAAPAAPAADKK